MIEIETSYLDKENDLVSLASSSDLAMEQLEDWIEDCLIRLKGFRNVGTPDIRTYPDSRIRRLSEDKANICTKACEF